MWVLATTNDELISRTPHGGTKGRMLKYELGRGADVFYGLVQNTILEEESKFVVNNLFTRFDLMDNLANNWMVGVQGTMRQIKLYHFDVPSKQEASQMERGEIKFTYIDDYKVIVTWKDG